MHLYRDTHARGSHLVYVTGTVEPKMDARRMGEGTNEASER